jgi:hypothetical protein
MNDDSKKHSPVQRRRRCGWYSLNNEDSESTAPLIAPTNFLLIIIALAYPYKGNHHPNLSYISSNKLMEYYIGVLDE